MVADSVPVIWENMRMIEKLDLIFSKGRLSLELDCVEPSINLDRKVKYTEETIVCIE